MGMYFPSSWKGLLQRTWTLTSKYTLLPLMYPLIPIHSRQHLVERSILTSRIYLKCHTRLYFPEEFPIFCYFPVVPSGTMLHYSTRKMKRNEEERQRNVISTSATADLHMYFLRRSAIKFTFLIKNNNHASTIMNNTIRLFV